MARNRITIPAGVSGLVYRMGVDALDASNEPYFTAFAHITRLAFDQDRQSEDGSVIRYVTDAAYRSASRMRADGGVAWHDAYYDSVLARMADMLEPYRGNETAAEIIAICHHPAEFAEFRAGRIARQRQSRDMGLDSIPGIGVTSQAAGPHAAASAANCTAFA